MRINGGKERLREEKTKTDLWSVKKGIKKGRKSPIEG